MVYEHLVKDARVRLGTVHWRVVHSTIIFFNLLKCNSVSLYATDGFVMMHFGLHIPTRWLPLIDPLQNLKAARSLKIGTI